MIIYDAIESLSSEYSVYDICNAIGINRSAYSYWIRKGKKTFNSTIMFLQEVIKVYAENDGLYGAPKIAYILNRNGINCSVSKVSRAMSLLGIRSIVTAKFPHRKSAMNDAEKALIVNLVKDLKINTINQVWTTDITYIKTAEGNYYLITYLDSYSRKVLSWNLSKSQTSVDMINVLKRAIKARKPLPGLILHSDKGSQMRSLKYRTFLSDNNIIPSYTSLNHSCDENAAQESFHALLKKECLYQHQIKNYWEAYSLISNYIEDFYNTKRLHSSLHYFSPCEFERSLWQN